MKKAQRKRPDEESPIKNNPIEKGLMKNAQ